VWCWRGVSGQACGMLSVMPRMATALAYCVCLRFILCEAFRADWSPSWGTMSLDVTLSPVYSGRGRGRRGGCDQCISWWRESEVFTYKKYVIVPQSL
jgi:hypothetical protein